LFVTLQAEVKAGRTVFASMILHAALARSFASAARTLIENGEAKAVALSGGCFQNAVLLRETLKWLGDVPVLIHRQAPANDGGLALGQAAIAAARLCRQAESN
jgi:hydrogenase maturation protein HypF